MTAHLNQARTFDSFNEFRGAVAAKFFAGSQDPTAMEESIDGVKKMHADFFSVPKLLQITKTPPYQRANQTASYTQFLKNEDD